jgi:hypothetical protein
MCQDSSRTIKCWAGLLLLVALNFILFIVFDLISSGVGKVYSVTHPVIYTRSAALLKQYLNIEL